LNATVKEIAGGESDNEPWEEAMEHPDDLIEENGEA
jgi:hypothetical protein